MHDHSRQRVSGRSALTHWNIALNIAGLCPMQGEQLGPPFYIALSE